jgi:hypothetical protein
MPITMLCVIAAIRMTITSRRAVESLMVEDAMLAM